MCVKIHSKIPKKLFGVFGAPRALRRLWTRFLARNRFVCTDKKNFGGAEGTSSALFRSTWSFGRSNLLARGSPGCPEPRFSRPRRLFFRGFCVRQAFDAQNVRHRQNTVKTNTKYASELLHIDRKSIKNRSASPSDCVGRRERHCYRLRNCPGGSWRVSGVPWRRFWMVPNRS